MKIRQKRVMRRRKLGVFYDLGPPCKVYYARCIRCTAYKFLATYGRCASFEELMSICYPNNQTETPVPVS